MSTAIKFLLRSGILLALTAPAWATQLYVNASTGNDTYNCTSATFVSGTTGPGLTIAHCESLSASGDTINIAAGTYRLSTSNSSTAGYIAAKTNQTLIGPACTPTTTPCTAIISGGVSIGGAATGPDGSGNYSVTGQTQTGTLNAYACDTGWSGCNYPEDLFFDGVPLQHVVAASEPTLSATQWWFDYTNNIIYFSRNPATHLVETSVLETMFQPNGASGVTVQNLTIEEFAAPTQQGAVDPSYGSTPTTGASTDWTIANDYITLNHGVGVRVAFGMHILNSMITVNGQFGIGGAAPAGTAITASGIVVQGNTITYNNYAHISPGFGAGGMKLGNTASAIVRGNTISNNIGQGLHFDVNSINPLIDGNTVVGNSDPAGSGGASTGIAVEISNGGSTVRNNVTQFNGTTANTGPDYQIGSADSAGMQAYCNVMEVDTNAHETAWTVFSSVRGSNTQPPFLGQLITSTANYVHHNTVIFDSLSNGTAGYAQNDTVHQPNFFAVNTPPDFNQYHVSSISSPTYGFIYDNNNTGANSVKTFADYQLAGADVHGTIDTVNGSGFPTVTITSPADQSSYAKTTSVVASASDGSGIASATLYVDWASVQTISGVGPITFTTPTLAQGAHTMAVMALANSGVKTCNAVTLTQTTVIQVPPSPILARFMRP